MRADPVAALRSRAARLVAGRGWAIGPTLTSIAASGTAAATTLVVARGIGAAAFGQFTVVLTIGLIGTVAMLLSLNYVMFQELPRSAPERHPALISTALFTTLLLGTGLVAAGLLAAPVLAPLLGVDARTLGFGLALALAMTVNQLTESFLRGLKKFRFVANLKLVVALGYLTVSAACLVVLGIRDPEFYLLALIVTNLVFALVALAGFPVVPRTASARLARSLYRHGLYVSAITGLSTVLFGIDIIFLNHWTAPADVGIYSIYNGFPKRLLGVLFTEGIGLVLLPTLATMAKPALLRRIGRLAPAVFVGTAGVSFVASAVFFLLLRAEYPYSPGLMALAALGIGAHTVFNLYFFALSMDGLRGARVFLACLAAGVPAGIGCQALFILWWGLVGALVGFAVTNLLLIAVIIVAVTRLYRPDPSPTPGTRDWEVTR